MVLLALGLLMLLWQSPALAATRWAGPTDTGAGDCTSSANRCDLQQAINTAQAGDTIIAVNGTYTGTYVFTSAVSGSSGAKITLQAENLHQAVIDGPNTCTTTAAFNSARQWWVFDGLRVREHGRGFWFTSGAHNNEIKNTILEDLTHEGIITNTVNGLVVRDSVFANLNMCGTTSGLSVAGIQLINSDSVQVINSAFIGLGVGEVNAVRPDGASFRRALPIFAHTGSDGGLFQGLLILSPMSTSRIFGPFTQPSANNHIFRDNIVAYVGNPGLATDDCVDDSNQYLNNIIYGSWGGWLTKGGDVTYGHHTVKKNLIYSTDHSWRGLDFASIGSNESCNFSKVGNILQDNIIYGTGRMSGTRSLIDVTDPNTTPNEFATKSHNLIFAEDTTESNAVRGYTYAVTDVRQRPIFTDPSNGDFTLAPGSPGENAASDATDIGISYNSFLRQSVMKHVVQLPIQEQTVSGSSSVSFPGVSTAHTYHVWVYWPEPVLTGNEQILVEGTLAATVNTTTNSLNNQVQAGGPQRWRPLLRVKPNDSTLNIAWSRVGYYAKIKIIELPTSDDAYTWLQETEAPDTTPPAPPTNLTLTTVSATEIDVEVTKPTAGDLNLIRLRYCINASCTPNTVLDLATTSSGCTPTGPRDWCYRHSGLQDGTRYRYEAAGVDTSGNESAFTAIQQADTNAGAAPTPNAHWTFNDASTTAEDATANNLDGTLCEGSTCPLQGPSWIAGQVSGAITCDGSDDNVQVADNALLNLAGNLTITFWLNLRSTVNLANNPLIITKARVTSPLNTPYSVEMTNATTPRLRWFHKTDGVTGATIEFSSDPDIPLNTWRHIALVRNNSAKTVALYVGGNLVQSSGYANDATGNTEPVRLCAAADRNAGRYSHISLDDLRIYDDVLTEAEIAVLAQGAMGETGVFAQEAWCVKRIDDPESGRCITGRVGDVVQGNQARVRTAVSRSIDPSSPQEFRLYARIPATSGTSFTWFLVDDTCTTNPVCYGFDQRVTFDTVTSTPQLTVAGKTRTSGGKIYKRFSTLIDQVSIGADQFIEREHAVLVRSDQTPGTTIGFCERTFGQVLDSCNEAIAAVVAPSAVGVW